MVNLAGRRERYRPCRERRAHPHLHPTSSTSPWWGTRNPPRRTATRGRAEEWGPAPAWSSTLRDARATFPDGSYAYRPVCPSGWGRPFPRPDIRPQGSQLKRLPHIRHWSLGGAAPGPPERNSPEWSAVTTETQRACQNERMPSANAPRRATSGESEPCSVEAATPPSIPPGGAGHRASPAPHDGVVFTRRDHCPGRAEPGGRDGATAPKALVARRVAPPSSRETPLCTYAGAGQGGRPLARTSSRAAWRVGVVRFA